MKASDARNLTDTAFSSGKITYLKNLYKTIEQAANTGINAINVKSPAQNIVGPLDLQAPLVGISGKNKVRVRYGS